MPRSMAKSQVPVEIVAVSYSPVGGKRPDTDFWAEVVAGDELDLPVRHRFTQYMLRCYHAQEVGFMEVEFSTSDGKFLREKLNKISKLGIDKKNVDRRDITQELSDRLSAKMAVAGGLAGAIFVVHAKIDKQTFVAIVKLDLGQQEVVALKPAAAERHLFSEVFERALPEEAKKFRKTVIIPSPGKGDARSGQFDAFSDYWQEFVGARAIREAKKAAEAILAAATQVLQDEGKLLPDVMASKLIEEVQKREAKDIKSVAEAVKEITGAKKKVANIEEVLTGEMGQASLEEVAPIARHQYKFSHHLEFTVDAALVKKGIVTVKEEGSDVVIRIKESSITRKDVIGRPS